MSIMLTNGRYLLHISKRVYPTPRDYGCQSDSSLRDYPAFLTSSPGSSAGPIPPKSVTDSSAGPMFPCPDFDGPSRGLLLKPSGEYGAPPASVKEPNDLLFLSPWFDGDNSDEGDSHDEGDATDAGDPNVTEFCSELSG